MDREEQTIKLALVSEYPPPAAGMTVLAEDFAARMEQQHVQVFKVRTNQPFTRFTWMERAKGLRGILKWIVCLWQCRIFFKRPIVHIFSSSGLNFFLFTIAPLMIARMAGCKTIVHYHGGGAESFFKRFPRTLKLAMSMTDELVVPSGFLKKVFEQQGFESVSIPNLANVERFEFQSRQIEKPIILSVRNLTKVYNVACTVRAFQLVQQAHPEAQLIIVGDGPERAAIEKQIQTLELKHVSLEGNVSNEQVVAFMRQANLLVNASNVDNMPGSILEAFASGLPVVSTRVGGIPYMIEDRKNGLLVEIDDAQKMAEKILELIRSPELVKQLTENARLSLKELDWENIYPQWISCYQKLLNSK